MYRAPRHFIKPTKNCAVERTYTINITQSELDNLIKLLKNSLMQTTTSRKYSGTTDMQATNLEKRF